MSLITNELRVIGNSMFKWSGVFLKLGNKLKNAAIAVECNYKFSRDGGAVGDINLKDEDGVAVSLPIGTIAWDGVINVKTAVTSGGSATLEHTLVSAGDLKAATAVASFSTDAKLAIIPVGTAASSLIPLVAAKTPKLTVAVAALTAGEYSLHLVCFKRNS